MRGKRQISRTRLAASLLASCSLLPALSGCGGSSDKFKNEARPPVPTQLTGVITDNEVTVSPDVVPLPPKHGEKLSAKELDTPIILIISNQTQQSHSVTLTGKDRQGKPIEARTPPINPLDTAQIQQTLPPGTYQVKAGSEKAVDPGEEIRSATLTVNPNRQTSSGTTLLP
jgi:hypothetical protein